jgi:hypothetical protein
MKRMINLALAGVGLAACLAGLASAQSQPTQSQPAQAQSPQSQSLGDYARAIRKDKPKDTTQTKQYDNDNLPRNEKLSVVGNAASGATDNSGAAAGSESTPDNGQPSSGTGAEAKAAQPAMSSKDRQAMYDDWKKKIADQKDKLDLATRELDVLQREYKLRAAAFYADAGNRLRNQTGWDKDDAQYKQDLAEKQKAVDEAKKQLEDLQEQARKAGAPNSARE